MTYLLASQGGTNKLAYLLPQDFKRLFGVKRPTFDAMVEVMQQHDQLKKKPSGDPKLTLEDQVLVALQYWREYRTYFHIAQDWEVSESTICRTVHKVETVLIRSGRRSCWKKVTASREGA